MLRFVFSFPLQKGYPLVMQELKRREPYVPEEILLLAPS